MSIGVNVLGLDGLQRYRRMFGELGSRQNRDRLAHMIGAVVESQTRRRITDEKTDPDSGRWQGWSKSYARTRHGNQSLLRSGGGLHDSIENQVRSGGNRILVGSPLTYARMHQEGFSGTVQIPAHTRTVRKVFGKLLSRPAQQSVRGYSKRLNMPARSFLGVSQSNEQELSRGIRRFFGRIIDAG